jgi:hypothetical protein
MSKRGGKRVVLKTRVAAATADTLRAIAEHRGETVAKLIEFAVQALIEVAKKPVEGEAKA